MLTKDFDFYVNNNRLFVKYLTRDKQVNLSSLSIEMIGITELDKGYAVTIVTGASIKKVKHQISESLEVIGFNFNTLEKALEVQNFILLKLSRIKKAKERIANGEE